MLLFRLAPEGFFAAGESVDDLRMLFSDPYETLPGGWELGRRVDRRDVLPLSPVLPGKIVGFGRTYRRHAEELGNEVPTEPLIFLKAPSAVIGPRAPIVLPAQSERVDFEGEIALVMRRRLQRATAEEALDAVLGVTCACDVTARDLQRRDATFARAKSFDSFCPLGPAIRVRPDFEALEVVTRINGEERQRGRIDMLVWSLAELLSFASQAMTLEAGDVVLTGTPSGVGPLADGDELEVEVSQVGTLVSPVEARRTP
ncbi:MAG: fumarylacetoacetate hydrolase family protein [Acidobacteriota bacterium]